ncbi:MAG: hypothetical protein AUJ52_00170 [Elusimicrobia bacterium CG1_02_63_36]|nr:MAG: hypothetical protein AUJ52_00170 [Elusimicrobia bacterium CG1_02_63_36]PIP82679.1 MAG: hypothetical protein COR54_13540 [Elusimicrobia bacterium CG22_combo_CG10-13_8_21_14_all_63_91]PJA14104.1 MAG: hypothetical protein COX66_13390 [Elusimicrobia bacterium CG_4_10_14_0_2_um_filter_63_34]
MIPRGRRGFVQALERSGPIAALAAAFFFNFLAGVYVNHVGRSLPSLDADLLLGALPRVDLTGFFVWGFAAFAVFVIAAGLTTERMRIPYIAWMYALLISTRALFIVLTPMGAPKGAFAVEGYSLFEIFGRFLTFKNDLFFSAHTSMPFLGFLIFRRAWVRIVFFAFSLSLAATVLLSRLHYSIDVAAAFFITCGVVWIHRELVEPPYRRWRARWLEGKSA